ncbi:DUF3153 domain-containing protein [Numidum massiliense]|uniref:DUF3153 domain-containing protein n=1 Tax=Numidum massiliense TaxID=1522315 RepID=UPI0006D56F56|nr:DUF3153 domain-containing protein [Numidum massiliense]
MGRRRNRNAVPLVLLFVVTVALTGCAQGIVEVEVNKDFSVDLHTTVGLDKQIANYSGELLKEVEKNLNKMNLQPEAYGDDRYTGYVGTRHYSLRELKKMAGDIQKQKKRTDTTGEQPATKQANDRGWRVDSRVEETLLQKKYDVKAVVNVQKVLYSQSPLLLGKLGDFEDQMIGHFLKQMNLQAKLTLPYDLSVTHNGTTVENDGKTIVWEINPVEDNTINVQFAIPHIRNIVIIVCGVLLLLIAVILIVRQRRGKNRKYGA